jgi:hypothetical protein
LIYNPISRALEASVFAENSSAGIPPGLNPGSDDETGVEQLLRPQPHLRQVQPGPLGDSFSALSEGTAGIVEGACWPRRARPIKTLPKYPDLSTSEAATSMMPDMRTTLTLDDDLEELLKRRARELGIPFKEMVNRTIRAGLAEATATRPYPAPKTISHSFGFRPGIDLDKLGQLADELEAEAFAEKFTILPT